MSVDGSLLDDLAEALVSGRCSRPVLTRSGEWVRCGSRVKSKCPSCAELYRGDWAAIARSGIFEGAPGRFRFYLLTLTAPSFGAVHRVPRRDGGPVRRCGWGVVHVPGDVGLRGVPLDPGAYDYAGQVAWNRDVGVLWDRTRRRVRDRWDSVEFFIVREWQDRGVLHTHVLMRIEAGCAPSPCELGAVARSAVATSPVDGYVVGWGEQVRCDAFPPDSSGAKAVWYLSKALNYVLKDVGSGSQGVEGAVWEHLAALDAAARRMRCSAECRPSACRGRVHGRYGSRSHAVSASRCTSRRPGWSFTGLTRTVQRKARTVWMSAQPADSRPTITRADRDRARWARERLRDHPSRRARMWP